MATCKKCGAELLPGTQFCTECGEKVTQEAQKPEQKPAEQSPAAAAPAVPYGSANQNASAANSRPADGKTDRVMGVGAFFWLTVLFRIPFLGLLMALILSFVPGNKNLRNFARANLIHAVIGIVIVLLLSLAARALTGFLKNTITDMFSKEEISDIFSDILGENAGEIAELIGKQ